MSSVYPHRFSEKLLSRLDSIPPFKEAAGSRPSPIPKANIPVMKEKEERQQKYEKAVEEILSWYEGRRLPEPPIKINVCETLNDVNKFFETNKARLQIGRYNNPDSRISYYRLTLLKNYIIKNS